MRAPAAISHVAIARERRVRSAMFLSLIAILSSEKLAARAAIDSPPGGRVDRAGAAKNPR